MLRRKIYDWQDDSDDKLIRSSGERGRKRLGGKLFNGFDHLAVITDEEIAPMAQSDSCCVPRLVKRIIGTFSLGL